MAVREQNTIFFLSPQRSRNRGGVLLATSEDLGPVNITKFQVRTATTSHRCDYPHRGGACSVSCRLSQPLNPAPQGPTPDCIPSPKHPGNKEQFDLFLFFFRRRFTSTLKPGSLTAHPVDPTPDPIPLAPVKPSRIDPHCRPSPRTGTVRVLLPEPATHNTQCGNGRDLWPVGSAAPGLGLDFGV
ncbi:hypothetical protein VUR80DRAFT_3496 [Thermomyces stellatus]